MADVESAVFATLQSIPEVVALIGSGAAMRAYPDAAAQGTKFPNIVFTVPSESREPRGGLVNAVVELNCYAEKQPAVTALKEAVRKAHGTFGQLGGQNVRGVFVEEVSSPYEPSQQGESLGFFVKSMALRFFIIE